jgi:methionyl-tRNA formyltransferase
MNTCVVVDNPRSWFVPFAERLVDRLHAFGRSALLRSAEDIPAGNEIAFVLSYEKKIPETTLARSRHNIVVHASALPQGKGMSPLTWQILEGREVIPISLFEAVAAIDAGPIYLQDSIRFQGHELLAEMQAALGARIMEMCVRFMSEYPGIIARAQAQSGPESRYRLRKPEDSRLDPNQTIAGQFNLLRVVDNERYPAFFEWRGRKYVLKISPAQERTP